MMTLKRIAVASAAVLLSSVPAQAQSVRKLDVSFHEGRVSIVAENVTLAEIFAEWARKGGSRIVNAERLPGTPVMLTEFKDQPEAAVLRTLLREAPGYGAAMRTTAPAGASTVQTVFILAVRSTTASSAAPPLQAQQPPTPSPQAAPRMIMGSPDDEIPPVRPLTPEQSPMTPADAPNLPADQPANPNLRMGPGGTVTSTIPGVIIPGPKPAPSPSIPPGARGRSGGGGTR